MLEVTICTVSENFFGGNYDNIAPLIVTDTAER
jgi:hypothetical protein